MANFVPNWVGTDSSMSAQNLMTPYTVGANPALLQGTEPSGMYVQGSDPSLGIGEFLYGQWSNATPAALGSICEGTQTLFTSGVSVSLITSFQLWQGTANSGKPLGVALCVLAQNQFGWFQIVGNALVATNGTSAINNPAYWQANGIVSSTPVASKQMLSTVFVLQASQNFGQGVFVPGTGTVTPTLTATQAIASINTPHAQGAIT